ncbi:MULTISPECIES: YbjQ family protein [Pseudomonas]|uniref:YbjQ family protein n=1 Tax=Pseudomonas TaxID=286 RepID=UPI00047F9484|nr:MULTISPECIES: YbjQ family protein [Pseudomonas]PRA54151.1 YbjQ family protein [Pseudomonas sp. MYb115]QXN48673.1 YbjQ family protein [Pseudomonas fluorescens]WSO22984.1 YbjQ family protein [Pseudomonas fluorescens]
MIITTTHSVEGRQIAAYLDVVSAESVQGINVVRDMFAGMRDFFGGRSQTLEKALREARAQATDELKERAAKLQADAVVGVNFEISMPSGKGSMLVVFVTGTAVRLK